MGLFEILKGEQPGLIKSLLHYEDVGQYGEYLTEYMLYFLKRRLKDAPIIYSHADIEQIIGH